jgi:hypothetical protein
MTRDQGPLPRFEIVRRPHHDELTWIELDGFLRLVEAVRPAKDGGARGATAHRAEPSPRGRVAGHRHAVSTFPLGVGETMTRPVQSVVSASDIASASVVSELAVGHANQSVEGVDGRRADNNWLMDVLQVGRLCASQAGACQQAGGDERS